MDVKYSFYDASCGVYFGRSGRPTILELVRNGGRQRSILRTFAIRGPLKLDGGLALLECSISVLGKEGREEEGCQCHEWEGVDNPRRR